MKKFITKLNIFIALLLVFAMTSGAAAFAEEAGGKESNTAAPRRDARAESEESVIDEAALQAAFEEVLEKDGLTAKRYQNRYAVGFCYLDTGEEWYINGDKFMYSASIYKLPLCMMVSEAKKTGTLPANWDYDDSTYEYVFDNVLLYSDNDLAHALYRRMGGGIKCRAQFTEFSDLGYDEVGEANIQASNFSPEYMIDILQTLYYEEERFPGVLSRMKQAQPGEFIRASKEIRENYEVAQKYGQYKYTTNVAGIIYTPHPVAVVILTDLGNSGRRFIADTAEALAEASLEFGTADGEKLPQNCN